MNHESSDKKQLLYDTKTIDAALRKFQGLGTEIEQETFSLIVFLQENGLLQKKFEENLQKWPKPIQTYINKRLFDYSRSEEYKQEDLDIINGFFETAFQETENCQEGQFPSERWEQAITSLAQELRRYYGLQENDEELPCWRRG